MRIITILWYRLLFFSKCLLPLWCNECIFRCYPCFIRRIHQPPVIRQILRCTNGPIILFPHFQLFLYRNGIIQTTLHFCNWYLIIVNFFPFFIINCKFKRLITDSIFIKISYYINPGQPTHLWDKILCSAHTLCIWRIIISICAITFAPKKSCARYPGQNASSTMIKSTVAIPILILFFIIFLFCFLLIFLLFLCEYK